MKIPDGLSGSQLMIFVNTLLPKLGIKTAIIWDTADNQYIGCEGQMETIPFIELNAIRGKTEGWCERFHFFLEDKEGCAESMREVYDTKLVTMVEFGQSSLEIEEHRKLGVVMQNYWENDKCQFSKIYHSLEEAGFFRDLGFKCNGIKTKVFSETENIHPKNLFFASQN